MHTRTCTHAHRFAGPKRLAGEVSSVKQPVNLMERGQKVRQRRYWTKLVSQFNLVTHSVEKLLQTQLS